MTVDIFIWLTFICAVVTSAITEAVKKLVNFKSTNVLAAVIAVIVGVAVAVLFAIYSGIVVSTTYVCTAIVLVVASWLSAMIGYDKVKQIIDQIREAK